MEIEATKICIEYVFFSFTHSPPLRWAKFEVHYIIPLRITGKNEHGKVNWFWHAKRCPYGSCCWAPSGKAARRHRWFSKYLPQTELALRVHKKSDCFVYLQYRYLGAVRGVLFTYLFTCNLILDFTQRVAVEVHFAKETFRNTSIIDEISPSEWVALYLTLEAILHSRSNKILKCLIRLRLDETDYAIVRTSYSWCVVDTS